jgi:hypothetical protein
VLLKEDEVASGYFIEGAKSALGGHRADKKKSSIGVKPIPTVPSLLLDPGANSEIAFQTRRSVYTSSVDSQQCETIFSSKERARNR